MPEGDTAATHIAVDQDVATLVNVFVVTPEHQQQLVELLEEATVEVMRHLPGFVSANLHASNDGTRVVNYAQWSSPAAFQAMLQDPRAQEHMTRAGQLATEFDPNLYRVTSTHRAGDQPATDG